MTIWLTTYLHISGIFSYFLGLTAYISGIIEYFYIFVFLFDTSWSNASDFGSLGVTFVPIGPPHADLHQVPPTQIHIFPSLLASYWPKNT